MLAYVSQRLLSDAEKEQLRLHRELRQGAVRIHTCFYPVLPREVIGEPLQSRHQAHVVQYARSQVLGQAPEFRQRPDNGAAHLPQLGCRILVVLPVGSRGQAIETLGYEHKGLGCLVMKLLGDALALMLLGSGDLLQIEVQVLLHLRSLGNVASDQLKARRAAFVGDQAGSQPK